MPARRRIWNRFGIGWEYLRHRSRTPPGRGSDQPFGVLRGADEIGEQRMRRERFRLQFRSLLDADEPGVILHFHDLRQASVRGHARKDQAAFFQPVTVFDIDLIAVAVALHVLCKVFPRNTPAND